MAARGFGQVFNAFKQCTGAYLPDGWINKDDAQTYLQSFGLKCALC